MHKAPIFTSKRSAVIGLFIIAAAATFASSVTFNFPLPLQEPFQTLAGVALVALFARTLFAAIAAGIIAAIIVTRNRIVQRINNSKDL